MAEMYNTKNAGVRRLMKEAMELRQPTEMYHAQPMEDNLFEWHFTIRGTVGTDFEGGIYHGRIIFPVDYPMKPPNLILLTPNGRFELNKKICLSISGYHPETWLPSWSIRTALLALIGFLPTTPGGALGSLDYPPKERKRLAKISADWICKECGCSMKDALIPITEDGQSKVSEKDAENQNRLQGTDSILCEPDLSAEENIDTSSSSKDSTDHQQSLPSPIVESSQGLVQDAQRDPAVENFSDAPLLFNQPNRHLASRNFDYSLLFKIPLAFICIAILVTLVARRFLVDNVNSLNDFSEL